MELRENIPSEQTELQKKNFVKMFPSKRNYVKTFPSERSAEAKLRLDITPRTELRKWNLVKTFLLTAELWNFVKTFPSEQSCQSGTSP